MVLCAGSLFASPLRCAIEPDHTNHIYSCGETATFTVVFTETNGAPASAGSVNASLDNFGQKSVAKVQWDLTATNRFTISGKLDEPGFLRLTVSGKDIKRTVWGVGYEPEKIKKGSPSPSDFDDFWRDARARFNREVPSEPIITHIPERTTDAFDFYRISFATYGGRVHGYMTVPKDKSLAPFPVNFEVSAAGFGGWTNDLGGRKDCICLRFGVYPFEPHWKWKEMNLKASYDAMNENFKKDEGVIYSCHGISKSREDYFFYPVILALDRAVDWAAKRPDVDKSRIFYQGTSQGGGFGFYLVGLNHNFARAAFFVPACTDTMGYLKGRCSGWPCIVESQRAENKSATEKNAPYFDGANFASRIRCPVRVSVGFADTTCPPCAVYASFNEIPVSDKAMLHGFGMTHSCRADFYKRLNDWLFSLLATH